MHRPEAIMRELPMSRRRMRERKASRNTKRRAMDTFSHDRERAGLLVPTLGPGVESISVAMERVSTNDARIRGPVEAPAPVYS